MSVDGQRLDIESLRSLLAFYLYKLVPNTLVEVTIVKGLTDGPHTAPFSRLSLTDSPAPQAQFGEA